MSFRLEDPTVLRTSGVTSVVEALTHQASGFPVVPIEGSVILLCLSTGKWMFLFGGSMLAARAAGILLWVRVVSRRPRIGLLYCCVGVGNFFFFNE